MFVLWGAKYELIHENGFEWQQHRLQFYYGFIQIESVIWDEVLRVIFTLTSSGCHVMLPTVSDVFQMLRLQSALEESQLNEKQLKHKLEVQTETLSNKMEELRALNEQTQSSMTSEMMEVQMKIMELENIEVGLPRLYWWNLYSGETHCWLLFSRLS